MICVNLEWIVIMIITIMTHVALPACLVIKVSLKVNLSLQYIFIFSAMVVCKPLLFIMKVHLQLAYVTNWSVKKTVHITQKLTIADNILSYR